METLNVVTGPSAEDRLEELGIDAAWLTNAVMAGEAEAMLCNELDPPMTRGLARFSRTVRLFREQALPHGWHFDNRRNLSRTINPSREFAVVAAAGNELTGTTYGEPSTKYCKGATIVEAVASNTQQLELDLGLGDLVDGDEVAGDLGLWVLLYHRDEDEIRVELSRPASMTGGFITGWSERVILPAISIEPTVFTANVPVEVYDVAVERRERGA